MLLTHARRAGRVNAHGGLVPMREQDRGLWDSGAIAEGVALVTAALRRGHPGPYQLQAAIAALHDEAPSEGETDWPQIEALYGRLFNLTDDNPVVRLNHVVAVAMARGPRPARRPRAARCAGRRPVAGDGPQAQRRPWPPPGANRRPRRRARGIRPCSRADPQSPAAALSERPGCEAGQIGPASVRIAAPFPGQRRPTQSRAQNRSE
jgi:hypothetical protein